MAEPIGDSGCMSDQVSSEKINELKEIISKLRTELEERESSMPAHSARPHQLMAIEELEETIEAKEAELNDLELKK
jgi:hypothetical protein